jgi:hypothetical protein
MSSSDASRRRGAFALLVRVAVFMLLFVGICEVWFRVVMPAAMTPNNFQRDPVTMYRFDPAGSITGLYTVGRLCLPGGMWRINLAGWNSSVEYHSLAERDRHPLISVVGDSYIEGYLTDTDEHVDAYLPKMLPGTESYAFGVSAWYLEQYVATCRYARSRFEPAVLVIFANEGDVRDSLQQDGAAFPYWWQIARRGDSFVEVPPQGAYVLSPRVALAKKSALIDYLRYNAKVELPGVRAASIPQPSVGGGFDAARRRDEGWQKLFPAADFMIGNLCEQNPGVPVVFVWDDGRRYMRPEEVARTPLLPDGRAIREVCQRRPQCHFLDLRLLFAGDWAAHRMRFEAADGGHWNGRTNRLIAQEVADYIESRGLLPTAD